MQYTLPPYGEIDDEPCGPSKPQRDFHQLARRHRYAFFLGGLGSGKTWAGAVHTVRNILANRAMLQAMGRRHVELLHLVSAPQWADLEHPWRHLTTILDQAHDENGLSLIAGKPRKGQRLWEIRLITGDVIHCFPSDPQNYKGANASSFWHDEIEEAVNPHASFKLCNARLREKRSPMLWGILTSTPADLGQGMAEHFQDLIAASNPNYCMVRSHTSQNPAYADGEYAANNAETMSERERRVKLGGEILPPDGSVYGFEFRPDGDDDDSGSIARNWRWSGSPRKDREYHICIDWDSHFHALLIETTKGATEAENVDVIFDEVAIDGVQAIDFCMRVVRMCERWGIDRKMPNLKVWCDAMPVASCRIAYSAEFWRGKVNYRYLRDDDKENGIRTVRWRLGSPAETRRVFLAERMKRSPSKRSIFRSLQSYKWQTRNIDGRVVQTNKVSQDSIYSHACDALRYYLWQRYWHLRWDAGDAVTSYR
jgi:hypothetical protein